MTPGQLGHELSESLFRLACRVEVRGLRIDPTKVRVSIRRTSLLGGGWQATVESRGFLNGVRCRFSTIHTDIHEALKGAVRQAERPRLDGVAPADGPFYAHPFPEGFVAPAEGATR